MVGLTKETNGGEKMTEERPKLQVDLNPAVFRKYYYLKEELQIFCQEQGLSKSGSKAELNDRIEHFLLTGEALAKPKKVKKVARTDCLTPESLIEENIVFSEVHRAFFKQELGKSFIFKVSFQNWLKANSGKNYREAIAIYPEIAAKKSLKIDAQFEYNTYIRDFFAENQGSSLQDAITCWKYKKALPGRNNYQTEDLCALDFE